MNGVKSYRCPQFPVNRPDQKTGSYVDNIKIAKSLYLSVEVYSTALLIVDNKIRRQILSIDLNLGPPDTNISCGKEVHLNSGVRISNGASQPLGHAISLVVPHSLRQMRVFFNKRPLLTNPTRCRRRRLRFIILI